MSVPLSAQAGPSSGPVRTSSRTKTKSQRAIDLEETNRAFALAKSRAKAEEDKEKKRKGKKAKQVYCLCKTSDPGPMIECGECNNWFHFSCINMSDGEAEMIAIYSVTELPSPPPPPGAALPPQPKRKASFRKPKKSKSIARSSTSSSNGDSESEASASHSDAESSSSTHSAKRTITKRRRVSEDAKPKQQARKVSGATPKKGELPPLRRHILDNMAGHIRVIFGDAMDEAAAAEFARELEEAMFTAFKEVANGKEVATARYKAQFNLLASSLSKPLSMRPSLLEAIRSRDLSPSQVAVLNSQDLASQQRLDEIERAKQASLEQTVKAKEVVAGVRFGRDGFEKVEDDREVEMVAIRRMEESARVREEAKRNSPVTEVEDTVHPPMMMMMPSPKAETQRKPSVIASPQVAQSPSTRDFAMTSAWGGEGDSTPIQADFTEFGNNDQGALDLSDIIAQDPIEVDVLEEEKGPSEMELLEAKPVGWSGSIINPGVSTDIVPPVSLRLISGRSSINPPPSYWSSLLPHDPIAITGRVPTATALQYLSDSRLTPGKELVVAAFTLDKIASDVQKQAWAELIDFHIKRDRHAIYLPFNNTPPPNTAKELYLIPLRPSDPSPEFTDLIDGYSLPVERKDPMFIGVFIFQPQKPRLSPPVPAPVIPAPAAPAAVPPNDQLQALMASLNPATLQSILAKTGGASPAPNMNLGNLTPSALQGILAKTSGGQTPPSVPAGNSPVAPSTYMPPPPMNFPPFPPNQVKQGYHSPLNRSQNQSEGRQGGHGTWGQQGGHGR
ncbi:hypothetical protein P7C73_g487, partial [Tremellales sp. Uapishka_1]